MRNNFFFNFTLQTFIFYGFFFISGIGGIMVMGVGIILSGVVILKFKLNARFVAGWIAVTAILYAFGE